MLRIKKFQSGGKNDFVRKEQELLYKLGYFGNVPYNKAVDGYYGNMTKAAEEAAIRDGKITRDQLNRFKDIASFATGTQKSTPSYKGRIIRGNPEVFKQQVDLAEKGLLKESDLDGLMGPKTRNALSQDKGLFQRIAESVGKSTTSIKKGAVKAKSEKNDQTRFYPSPSLTTWGLPTFAYHNNESQSHRLQVPSVPLDRDGKRTTQCAAYVNGLLESKGLSSYGDAYSINDAHRIILNGYDDLDTDSVNPTMREVTNFNKQAANNFKANFNADKLNKNHLYTVNLYYTGSPYTVEFFNKAKERGSSSYATHAGIVYYNGQKWMVTDNIHGKVYNRSLNSVLGSSGKIGITSIADAGTPFK